MQILASGKEEAIRGEEKRAQWVVGDSEECDLFIGRSEIPHAEEKCQFLILLILLFYVSGLSPSPAPLSEVGVRIFANSIKYLFVFD